MRRLKIQIYIYTIYTCISIYIYYKYIYNTIWIIVIHNICITWHHSKKNDFLWDRIMSEHHLHQHQPTSWIPRVFNMELSKVGVRNHPSERLKPMVGDIPFEDYLHVVWSTFVCPNIGYSTKRRPTTSIPKTCRARTVPEAQLSCPVSWWKKPTAGTGKTYRTKEAKQIGCCWTSVSIPPDIDIRNLARTQWCFWAS